MQQLLAIIQTGFIFISSLRNPIQKNWHSPFMLVLYLVHLYVENGTHHLYWFQLPHKGIILFYDSLPTTLLCCHTNQLTLQLNHL